MLFHHVTSGVPTLTLVTQLRSLVRCEAGPLSCGLGRKSLHPAPRRVSSPSGLAPMSRGWNSAHKSYLFSLEVTEFRSCTDCPTRGWIDRYSQKKPSDGLGNWLLACPVRILHTPQIVINF